MTMASHILKTLKWSSSKTNWFLMGLVALISLVPFLIACPEWFFDGEDWGLVFKGAQCAGLRDFFGYFLYGKVNNLAPIIATDNPTALASMTSHDSFFTVYYRPMLLAMHAIQYQFLNIHAYAYFVFIIMMHASISTLLFYLLATLVQPGIAFLCSLFFTFHPILYGWFGRIDTQQHHMNVLLMLVLFMVFKKYLETGRCALYILACFIFFISLLTRETMLIFPGIMLLWSFLLSHYTRFEYLKKPFNKIILLSGFCIIICFYFFIKSITYPIISSTQPLIFSSYPTFSIQQHIGNIISFTYNLFWLQWFPWTAYDFFKNANLLILFKFIKLIIVFCIIALFITNKKKQLVIVSMLTAVMLYWPPLLFASRGGLRLFYESLPFMMLAIAYLLNYSTLMNKRMNKFVVCVLFSSLIFANGYAIIKSMQHMMILPKKIDAALQNLKKSPPHDFGGKPFLIINMQNPNHAIGIIQAIALLGINSTRPSYFFRNVTVHTTEKVQNINQLIHIHKHKNSIRLFSLNPEKVWFEASDFEEFLRPVVIHMTINQITHDTRIIDLSLNFEKDFYHPDLKVLIWFFQQEQFVALE